MLNAENTLIYFYQNMLYFFQNRRNSVNLGERKITSYSKLELSTTMSNSMELDIRILSLEYLNIL